MAVKFDDIAKTATEVLNDDYAKGYTFKTKQKTSFDGAVVTTAVDIDNTVSAKMTWKLPAPLGYSKICIDKLEMDKGGKYKMECSSDKLCSADGVKLECKSDLVGSHKVGIIYTGMKDCRVNVEAPATDPLAFTADASYKAGNITCATKFTMDKITTPDIAARYTSGPLFAALCVNKGLTAFNSHLFYKVSPELKCALKYEAKLDKVANGSLTAGCAYALPNGWVKAKVADDMSLCLALKHSLSKGFDVLASTTYNQKGDMSCGFSLNVE